MQRAPNRTENGAWPSGTWRRVWALWGSGRPRDAPWNSWPPAAAASPAETRNWRWLRRGLWTGLTCTRKRPGPTAAWYSAVARGGSSRCAWTGRCVCCAADGRGRVCKRAGQSGRALWTRMTPRLAFCRGSAMAALGDVEPALQEFRRGLALAAAAGEEGGDWLRSQLLVNIAVLQAPREEETSRRQLARALAICPDNVDAAYNLSLLLVAAGKTEAARRIWQLHGFRPEDAARKSSSSVGAPQAAWLEARLSQWHVRSGSLAIHVVTARLHINDLYAASSRLHARNGTEATQ
ncbi:hypothetical protein MRX96_002744 [Rhipicephalus microplus]